MDNRISQRSTHNVTTSDFSAVPTSKTTTPSLESRILAQASRRGDVARGIGSTLEASRGSPGRSEWNASGPLATRLREVTAASVASPTSAVMQRSDTPGGWLRNLAAAALSGPARAAKVALAVGMVASSLMTAVPTAAYAQQIGTVATSQVHHASALQVRSLDEVASRFSDDQKVYVVGNVQGHNLDQLEQYIERNAPYMTVVVVGRYDRSGTEVDHFIGRRLTVDPVFQGRVDARSGQPNGVVALVALDNGTGGRDFKWYASDAQKHVGLSNSEDVINAFRSAGGEGTTINQRVRAVVAQMNGAIDDGVARDAQTAASAIANARGSADQATSALRDFEAKLGAFKAQHPDLAGSLVSAPVTQWRADLKGANVAIAGADKHAASDAAQRQLGNVSATANNIQADMARYLTAMTAYNSAPAIISHVEKSIADSRKLEHHAAGDVQLTQAERFLASAREQYQRGDLTYSSVLDQATASSLAATDAIKAADSASAQQTLFMEAGLAALLLGLAGGLAVANVRRRKVKGEAESRLAEVETGLNGKLEKLIDCMKAAETYIGKSPADARAKFEARTLELANSVIEDVGTLFVMQGSAKEMEGQARAKIEPKGVVDKVVNLFSKRNYSEALAILRDQPVTFSPDSGLTVVLGQDLGSKSWKDALSADIKSFKPFSMTFENLMAEFDKRATRAGDNFERIKSSLLGAKSQLEQIEAQEAGIRELVIGLKRKDAGDGLFQLPAVERDVLPAAEQLLVKANKQRDTDPVGALEGAGATADRMMDDAALLAKACVSAHDDVLPELAKARDTLGAADLKTDWIGAATERLSKRAAAISESLVEASAEADVAKLSADIMAHKQRVDQAVTWNKKRTGPSPKAIADATKVVAGARAEIGKAVGVAATAILHESGLDPDTNLANAASSLATSGQQLSAGKIEEAGTSLGEVDAQVAATKALVAEAQTSVKTNATRSTAAKTENGSLDKLAAANLAIFKELQGTYAPAALSALRGVEKSSADALASSKAHVAAAEKAYAKGDVITAARELSTAEADAKTCRGLLDGITGQQAALAKQDQTNASAAQEGGREAGQLGTDAGDKRVRRNAASQAQSAIAAMRSASNGIDARGRDPKNIATTIAIARSAISSASSAVQADCDAYDAAELAISSASVEVSSAQSYSDGGYSASSYGDGSSELATAQSLLRSGDYEGAKSAASSAESSAESGIASAHRRAEDDRETVRQAIAAAAAAAAAERERQDEANRQAAASAAAAAAAASAASQSSSGNDGVTTSNW